MCLVVASDDRVDLTSLRCGELGEVLGHVSVASNHENPMCCHGGHTRTGWFGLEVTYRHVRRGLTSSCVAAGGPPRTQRATAHQSRPSHEIP